MFLDAHGYLFLFFLLLLFSSNRCGVLQSYTTCHSNKRLELYLNHGCVFANALLHCYSRLNCGSSVISCFCLQQCIDCVLNLPLNERQCLVPAKQGVYAIINHDNLRQKAS